MYETGNPLIDRGTNRFSFWNFPSGDNNRLSVQTDWRGQTEFTHKNLLSEYYLERPDYILPETGLFNSPSINYQPNINHYDRMIDNLRNNMSSMNSFDSSFNNYFSDRTASNIPSRFSSYSSNSFFS
ncbi:hypothetical protein [Providencia huaxiensis]|uniref:hypothetical protein n=1 Tax=Providencia huaxiensis TaxID=2027290 RepID=UPI0034DD0297